MRGWMLPAKNARWTFLRGDVYIYGTRLHINRRRVSAHRLEVNWRLLAIALYVLKGFWSIMRHEHIFGRNHWVFKPQNRKKIKKLKMLSFVQVSLIYGLSLSNVGTCFFVFGYYARSAVLRPAWIYSLD